jgi:guanylate cyclase, other
MCNAQTDIYAFGIILYEVYTRKDPSDGEEPSEVLRLVTDNEVDNRPVLPLTCSAPVQSLIIDCLEEASDKRPTSEELDIRLKRLETKNDLDSARKVDSHDRGAVSLFDIFPAHIAEALSQGKKVEPEYRDVVTIFFSDIVNFTTISSSLEPRKVAQMLDRLYSVFDELSHKHDVFKVETIGDAYMAVTNLVNEQPNDHTKRIACFAIDAIEAAQKVMIDEDNPGAGYISIRVGFHSGPVVADVVGNRNPRYCLFGDTVNCASRMESNSDINRILCSDYSAQLLNAQCPEIPVAARGMVAIKGKGEMSTFWVNERGMGLKSNSGHDLKGWLSILSPDEEQPRDNLDVRNKYQSSEPTLRRSFRLLQKLSGLDTSGHRSRENKST